MAFCSQCGQQVPADTKFCPFCGAALETEAKQAPANAPAANDIVGQVKEYININGPLPEGEEKEDAEKNQLWGILAYVFFAIPLIGAKDSKFAKFHANNSLWIFICGCALSLLLTLNSIIFPAADFGIHWLFSIIYYIPSLALFLVWLFGLIHAIKGMKKELPLVGHIKLIK